MPTPTEKLAQSLDAIKKFQDKDGVSHHKV